MGTTVQFFRGNLVVFLGLLTLIYFILRKYSEKSHFNKSFDLLAHFCGKIFDQEKNPQKNPNWGRSSGKTTEVISSLVDFF